MPTSIIVVAIRISVFLFLKSDITFFFSASSSLPCIRATLKSLNTVLRNLSYIKAAPSDWRDADSSITGYTIYACLPEAIFSFTNS